MTDYNEAVWTLTLTAAFVFVIIAIVATIDIYFRARKTLNNAKQFFKDAAENEREASKYHE